MDSAEGVIKYQLQHRPAELDAAIAIADLEAWRHIMWRLRLIGQNPKLYDGLGYGNISQRLPQPRDSFLISGTQTGHLPHLSQSHYCHVLHADAWQNSLQATGPCQPSSEALTHAVIYQQLPDVQCVIHVHCPEIWRYYRRLGLAATPKDVAYGSVGMAGAVKELLGDAACLAKGMMVMLGHQDGVVAFGADPASACTCLIRHLASSLARSASNQPTVYPYEF